MICFVFRAFVVTVPSGFLSDCDDVLQSANEDDAIGNRRREQLVLRTCSDDEDVAVLAGQVELAVGSTGDALNDPPPATYS